MLLIHLAKPAIAETIRVLPSILFPKKLKGHTWLFSLQVNLAPVRQNASCPRHGHVPGKHACLQLFFRQILGICP